MKKLSSISECLHCPVLHQSVFSAFTPDELEKLTTTKSIYQLKKGQVLFFENDRVKGLHCVNQGKVKLYKTMEDGSVKILKLLKEGDITGYRGLLGGGTYIASAETLEPSQVCFFPKEVILEMIGVNKNFAMALMARFADDLRIAEKRSVDFQHKSSRERLAETILFLNEYFGTDVNGQINVSLTRQEIAEYSGMAQETVIRLLHAWENDGILDLNKKNIMIRDKEKLLSFLSTEI